MSELTKIAAILCKNLSNALAAAASEIDKLGAATPLSQASKNEELVSIRRTVHKLPYGYSPRNKILVRFPESNSSFRMRVLKKLSDHEYLVYQQGGLKKDAKKISVDWILGLDPDR